METKKFKQLDTLRFFSVFVVLCAHLGLAHVTLLHRVFSADRGVDVFFVISGFLITLGLIKSKEKPQSIGTSLYKFYIRRSLRIFPIYYLILLLVWFFDNARVADTIWWNVTYTSNFYSIYKQTWGGLGHLWSLAIEEQFYLVWPFIILFTPKRFLPYVIIGSILFCECTRLFWFLHSYPWWNDYMHPMGSMNALGLGALLAYFFYSHEEELKRLLHNRYIVIGAFAIMALAQYARYSNFPFPVDRLCTGIFAVWLVGRTVFTFGGVVGYILDNRVLRYIGTISYCVYLIHPLVPDLFKRFDIPHIYHISFFIYVFTTIAISSVSWYTFESQILKLKKYFI